MANRNVAHAVRAVLVTAGAVGAGVYGATSTAQEAIEEIVITGTRIQNANLVSSSPVTQIDAEEFALSGTTRVEDLINTFPQLAPAFDSFTVNPTTGFATADLRGLGSQRTLVLLNGKRLQPGGIRSESVDLNQVPAALVKRVEVLTGGASAVYGSDAIAGVVNFILDNEFEGVSLDLGYSAYQHSNGNSYMQGLMDNAGYEYPTGSSFDGKSYTVDFAVGGQFAEGAGHAMGYFTYLNYEELLQGERDYSSCALNSGGTACGGSSSAPKANFLVFGDSYAGFANIDSATGAWRTGTDDIYNFAPINHYQRPDERWTLGGNLKYEISPSARPYMEFNFSNTNTRVQIAQTGTFYVNPLELDCANPAAYFNAAGGDICGDLGLAADEVATVYAGKRNIEGGPRVAVLESSAFRGVAGIEGDLFGSDWFYDAYFLYGRTTNTEANINDFLVPVLQEGLEQCPPGSSSTCVPYNLWVPPGSAGYVTPEAAAAQSGAGLRSASTSLLEWTGYVSGNTPLTIPSAVDPISVVAGVTYAKNKYERINDANFNQANFTGAGGPRPNLLGEISRKEFYLEAGVPFLQEMGALESFSADLGYRYSDYSTSGGVNTFKVGLAAQVWELKFRGGFNRAIRAPSVGELFAVQQIALWSGEDPCSTATPSLTQAQCANTGVSAAQYRNILANPAEQYNQFVGGNPNLEPEQADTYTFGVVATPIDRLQLSLDYYDIKITDQIGTIGASTTLQFCATTADPFLCDKVRRNAASGDLWVGSDPTRSGLVENLNDNFGELHFQGLDLSAFYSWDMLAGTWSASLVGTVNLKQEITPLPGVNSDATFDCAGVINVTCSGAAGDWAGAPKWKHTARISYSWNWLTTSLRWRYRGQMDYENTDGTPGTTDKIMVGNGGKIKDYNWFDLTGVFDVSEQISVTVGVNNLFDEEPPLTGSTVALNGNSIGGYDQLGRYIFAQAGFKF